MLDSLTKLRRIVALCTRLGVHTQPRQLGNLWVAPLLSWHHHRCAATLRTPAVDAAHTHSRLQTASHPHAKPGHKSNQASSVKSIEPSLPAAPPQPSHRARPRLCSFDTEPDIPGVPPPSPWTVSDYSACKWPQSVPGRCRRKAARRHTPAWLWQHGAVQGGACRAQQSQQSRARR